MPSSDPDLELFRQRAAQLRARQQAGVVPPPGEISQQALAEELGMSRRKLRQTLNRAILKFTRALRSDLQP